MRPIPAPRLGDAHGLLQAISQRDRVRLDEFVTEFSMEELFPPGLENALGRTRQFVSYARSAGLLKEDRGTVELTDLGKRYVRSGDPDNVFDVAPGQAEWLLRQLRERHMTDSIYHGIAIGLSLYSSNPEDFHVSMLDFGRALGHLGSAGWDNENTFTSQGERYTTLLHDLGLIDDERRLTEVGQLTKSELTLPVHMSLRDLAGQLNPGGLEAAQAEGEAEWAELAGAAAAEEPPEAAPEPAPVPAAAEPEGDEEAGGDEWEDVRGTATPSEPAAASSSAAAPEPAPAAEPATPAATERPVPPPDIWDTAAPSETTRPIPAVTPAEGEGPPGAEAPDVTPGEPLAPAAAPEPDAGVSQPEAPAPETAPAEAQAAPAAAMSSGDPLAAPSSAAPAPPAPPEPPPAPEPAAASEPPPAPEPAPAPPPEPAPAAAAPAPAGGRKASGFLDVAAVKSAAEAAGLRLPDAVYANAAAALASGKHLVITGPAGSGKTTLALAIAKAAAKAGRSSGAALATAGPKWSSRDTLGRMRRGADGETVFERGHVLAAAENNKWLIVDELERADLDRAFGDLSSFLGGLPVALPDGSGDASAPDTWRIVATRGTAGDGAPAASAALLRRFAHVRLPAPEDADLAGLIDEAAGGDATAAGAVRRLLPLRELGDLGAGPFLDAARHAAERNALAAASEGELARECLAAYLEPQLERLDDAGRRRLRELADSL